MPSQHLMMELSGFGTWRPNHGRQALLLLGAVAAEPGGRYVIAADDSILKILDLKSGAELAALAGHRYRVDAVATTPDGRLAVSASDDATLNVWDLEARRGLHMLAGHRTGVLSVAV